jgi:hypothetical protein
MLELGERADRFRRPFVILDLMDGHVRPGLELPELEREHLHRRALTGARGLHEAEERLVDPRDGRNEVRH